MPGAIAGTPQGATVQPAHLVKQRGHLDLISSLCRTVKRGRTSHRCVKHAVPAGLATAALCRRQPPPLLATALLCVPAALRAGRQYESQQQMLLGGAGIAERRGHATPLVQAAKTPSRGGSSSCGCLIICEETISMTSAATAYLSQAWQGCFACRASVGLKCQGNALNNCKKRIMLQSSSSPSGRRLAVALDCGCVCLTGKSLNSRRMAKHCNILAPAAWS